MMRLSTRSTLCVKTALLLVVMLVLSTTMTNTLVDGFVTVSLRRSPSRPLPLSFPSQQQMTKRQRTAVMWSTNERNDGLPQDNSSIDSHAKTDSINNRKDWQSILRRTVLSIGLCISLSFPSSPVSANPAYDRYWATLGSGDREAIVEANTKLLDHLVGTVNTMYFDNSGGAFFTPREFYGRFKTIDSNRLASRNGVIDAMRYMLSTLNDPFSAYLTREELLMELKQSSNGFLGLGAIVQDPTVSNTNDFLKPLTVVSDDTVQSKETGTASLPLSSRTNKDGPNRKSDNNNNNNHILSGTTVADLPVVTAVAPNSLAERFGLTVGDRIVAVSDNKFLGKTPDQVARMLPKYINSNMDDGNNNKSSNKNNDEGLVLTIAKPIRRQQLDDRMVENGPPLDVVVGYKTSRLSLPPPSSSTTQDNDASSTLTQTPTGTSSSTMSGDSIVQYKMLTDSFFGTSMTATMTSTSNTGMASSTLATPTSLLSSSSLLNSGNILSPSGPQQVGYIRLTRFSRTATAGYIRAIEDLERQGADSYIIDLRNNYGGTIQEAMLTASTLLRDPHAVLCYTMNSRGGFTPHDAEEYIVDKRYPGYLLSKESRSAALEQVRRESPEMLENDGAGWVPPSSFVSLHEQTTKRGIHMNNRYPANNNNNNSNKYMMNVQFQNQLRAQKKLVILINEGTASSAEVFASALHDNGRAVALVGTKTYGKGLIQHTFPMPDGGGLRLTVAEYLTPALQHVTKVGGARFDSTTGAWVGGGIRPDVYCDSRQGIPQNVGADLCVGVAIDTLEEARQAEELSSNKLTASGSDRRSTGGDDTDTQIVRAGGTNGGSGVRRAITAGVRKDTF